MNDIRFSGVSAFSYIWNITEKKLIPYRLFYAIRAGVIGCICGYKVKVVDVRNYLKMNSCEDAYFNKAFKRRMRRHNIQGLLLNRNIEVKNCHSRCYTFPARSNVRMDTLARNTVDSNDFYHHTPIYPHPLPHVRMGMNIAAPPIIDPNGFYNRHIGNAPLPYYSPWLSSTPPPYSHPLPQHKSKRMHMHTMAPPVVIPANSLYLDNDYDLPYSRHRPLYYWNNTTPRISCSRNRVSDCVIL